MKTLRAAAAASLLAVPFTGHPTGPPELPVFDCLIEPHMTVALSTRAQGVLERVHVDRGDPVEVGQVLATLEAGVERATVELASARAQLLGDLRASEASLEYGRRKQARYKDLFRKSALPAQDREGADTEAALAAAKLLKAQEDRQIAELQLRQAQETLALRTLRSPIRGVVADRLLAPGESVEDRAILRLAQLDPLDVEVVVPVAHFGAFRAGMTGVVTPESPLEGTYRATVQVVDRVVDAASGTFRVRLELPNPDYALPGGLKCSVRFLPASAADTDATGSSPPGLSTPQPPAPPATPAPGGGLEAATEASRAASPAPASVADPVLPVAVAPPGTSAPGGTRPRSPPARQGLAP